MLDEGYYEQTVVSLTLLLVVVLRTDQQNASIQCFFAPLNYVWIDDFYQVTPTTGRFSGTKIATCACADK